MSDTQRQQSSFCKQCILWHTQRRAQVDGLCARCLHYRDHPDEEMLPTMYSILSQLYEMYHSAARLENFVYEVSSIYTLVSHKMKIPEDLRRNEKVLTNCAWDKKKKQPECHWADMLKTLIPLLNLLISDRSSLRQYCEEFMPHACRTRRSSMKQASQTSIQFDDAYPFRTIRTRIGKGKRTVHSINPEDLPLPVGYPREQPQSAPPSVALAHGTKRNIYGSGGGSYARERPSVAHGVAGTKRKISGSDGGSQTRQTKTSTTTIKTQRPAKRSKVADPFDYFLFGRSGKEKVHYYLQGKWNTGVLERGPGMNTTKGFICILPDDTKKELRFRHDGNPFDVLDLKESIIRDTELKNGIRTKQIPSNPRFLDDRFVATKKS